MKIAVEKNTIKALNEGTLKELHFPKNSFYKKRFNKILTEKGEMTFFNGKKEKHMEVTFLCSAKETEMEYILDIISAVDTSDIAEDVMKFSTLSAKDVRKIEDIVYIHTRAMCNNPKRPKWYKFLMEFFEKKIYNNETLPFSIEFINRMQEIENIVHISNYIENEYNTTDINISAYESDCRIYVESEKKCEQVSDYVTLKRDKVKREFVMCEEDIKETFSNGVDFSWVDNIFYSLMDEYEDKIPVLAEPEFKKIFRKRQ